MSSKGERIEDKGVVIPGRLIQPVAGALKALEEMTRAGIKDSLPEDMHETAVRIAVDPIKEAHDILIDKDKWFNYDEAAGCRKSADIVRLAVDNARQQSKEDGEDGPTQDE